MSKRSIRRRRHLDQTDVSMGTKVPDPPPCPECKPSPSSMVAGAAALSFISIGFTPKSRDGELVLVLDDEEKRHAFYAQQFAGEYTVKRAKTVAQAIALLDKHVFEIAHLDYDLFLTDTMNGSHVVDHIIQMAPEKRPKRVLVHSWNDEAAHKMCVALREAGVPAARRPFRGA